MEHETLELIDLIIGYDKPIIKNLNSSLNRGEFVVLFGSNGAGKSTLIKTLTQQNKSIGGEVKLNNRTIQAYSKSELSKQIAIVSTDHHFDLNLTVYDILALGRLPYLNLLGRLKTNDIEIIHKYTTVLNIDSLLKSYFSHLSDGQKQKVLIARALIQNAPVIILDEPTAHLDIKNRFLIFELLKKIAQQEGKIIICATHEIDVALKNCTKVWIIDKSRKFIQQNSRETNLDKIYSMLF